MALNQGFGFQNLLKDGYKHYAGLEEAILRNIGAVRQISDMTKTSLGPNGMNKMVVNHLDKVFITSDAATILREVEVNHPAAKMIAMAARMQEAECGDMTNFVISFAGELLNQAELLIKTGLHPSDVISGYETAAKETQRLIPELCKYSVTDFLSEEQILPVITSVLCPKVPIYHEFFSKLVTKCCMMTCGGNPKSFDVDHIRVAKILGGSLYDSEVIKGMLIGRSPDTTFDRKEKAKVAVFGCPFVIEGGETKSNLLIKTADDLLNFSKQEEKEMEMLVKGIADTGVTVVVVGGSIGELSLHFFEKYGIMVIKSMSKFEVKRLCKCLGAQALAKLGVPTAEEIGYADVVHVKEFGSDKVTVFERSGLDITLSTILLRGATSTLLEDVERAIDDGINTYRVMLRDPRFLYGAGATESYLVNAIEKFSNTISSLDQYSCARYGQCLEIIPKILLDNCGLDSNTKLPEIHSMNTETAVNGVDVLNNNLSAVDKMQVFDHLESKLWAIKLASDAAITVLRVDQIIVSKPAGGPKPKSNAGWDNDDDHC